MGLDIVKESATYKVERYKKKLERKSKDQELQQLYTFVGFTVMKVKTLSSVRFLIFLWWLNNSNIYYKDRGPSTPAIATIPRGYADFGGYP